MFVERLDLITWLEGASEESEYITPLEGVDDASAAAAGVVGAGDAGAAAAAAAEMAAATSAAQDSANVASGAAGGVATIPSAGAGAGLGVAGSGKTVDPRLQEIYNGERKMGDRNSVLRGIKPTVCIAFFRYAVHYRLLTNF